MELKTVEKVEEKIEQAIPEIKSPREFSASIYHMQKAHSVALN